MFSLGAVLAFAATGEGPFGAGSTAALVYRVVYSEPDTARLPAELRPLVNRCLAKDPPHRPTATQLLAELTARPAGPARPAAAASSPLPRRPRPARDGPPQAGTDRAMAHPPTEYPAHPPTEYPAHPPTERAASAYTPDPARPAGRDAPAATAPTERAAGPPAQRRRSGWRWLLTAAAAVLLAGAAVGTFLALRPRPAGHQAARSAVGVHPAPLSAHAKHTTPRPTQPPGTPAMATLGSYLARSASVRPTVQAAIDGVETCSQSPASGEATLQQAISTRQQIVSGLRTLAPSGLPHGAQLVTRLTTAMQDSITADRDYQGWMAGVASSGGCGSNPATDPSYAAGQQASGQATAAKNAFLAIWNPMAPAYRQPAYSSTDF